MQNNYQGPPEDFAMVVPVPVVLQKENVKTLPKDVFDARRHARRAAARRVLGAGPLPPSRAATAMLARRRCAAVAAPSAAASATSA